MLAHERIGSGEPLVLVHGIGHRRQAWYPVVDRLAREREVILIDLPGHGESPALVPDGRPVRDILRDILEDFFVEQGLDRPHIAGNSLGGRIALEAAADHLVSSATTLAPAGFWRNRVEFAYIRAVFTLLTGAATIAQPVAPAILGTRPGRAAAFGLLMTKGHRLSPEAALGDLRGLVHARPALETIIDGGFPFDRRIDPAVPVTVAWGTRDLVLLPYQAGRARRALPHAEHVTLPKCGHVPMIDDVDLVADVLLTGSAHPRLGQTTYDVA
ncbi:alpha/beta hydrolase [Nocardioides carbamazepini]|uniref:alpha/beta fold hydrolase n=1 Tax=Nocardioides carbamazepini TaxID=2854259 RepID=UPI00214A3A20|nr:alpha/beta hydrolase [Nocardioides carbamazepini]MCR1786346.1 alpha/beta hydrolase [Nocardioides carbamazepini]